MKKRLALGGVYLSIALVAFPGWAQSGGHAVGRRAQDRFVGAWRLAWLEQPAADGAAHKIECCGLLVYTRDGHMSVQVMEREPPAGAHAGTEQYAQGGYEASYGRYDIDEGAHTFTFHVEGALVRTLIGKDLPRAYEFAGKQLIVRSTRADEHWRVAWERY
jgi:hypothetical protein